MAKKAKHDAVQAEVAVAVGVEAAEAPAANLTKRNRVPVSAVLVRTEKAPKDRADHTKLAWEVVEKALPATAAEVLKALEAAAFDETTKRKLVSYPAYLSYVIRRGLVAPKAAD